MSRVTALRLHEDQSCEVWVDGAMLVRTDALLVHEEGLEVGTELEPEDVRRLCTRASISDAKQRAFLLLGYRPYCGAELKKRLEEQFEPAVAEAAVRRAQELGYIDDEKYAEMLARELFLRKGWSLRRASFEMYDRGLPAELVEPQLAGYEDDEVERAAAVLEKKYLRKLSDPKGRRSALAALQRLGFAYPDTKEALSLILDDLPEDGGEAED